ncbi:MAG: HAMP domain-containing protein [Sulfuricella denitrificans]|nr:HAMP domain-containing protein [Sulfuricella denitrificans]
MKNWGIKGRVLFLALVPALIIAVGLTIYDITTRLHDIEQALHERGLAIARQLSPASEFGVFSGNYDILTRLAQSTLLETDVTAVAITNTDWRILATSGHYLAPPSTGGGTLDSLGVVQRDDALIFSAPIFQSQTIMETYLDSNPQESAVKDEAKVLGYVIVEISRLSSIARKNQLIFNSLLITLTGLAVAALLALRMARQVTEPIMALAGAVARIGKGDLATRIQTEATGELATLERGVNNMAVALKSVQDAQEERRSILSTVLDSLDALVYVADMETHELLFLNKYAQNTFGNVTGKICWQALQLNQSGPCAFCTNARLTRSDGTPGEPVISEYMNSFNQRWYLIQDSAIKWVDGRIVRLEIATDITDSKQAESRLRYLEKKIMEISEREREQIGHELHDGLGQQLTGIAFMSKALSKKLASQNLKEAADATQIVTLINQAISETRQLARGLQPVEVEEHGLMSALEELARNIEKIYSIDCKLVANTPVALQDNAIANHLYRIAQEASNNAVRHGHATNISIELSAQQGRIQIAIRDNGTGFESDRIAASDGMGFQIMHYRASMIGAKLEIESTPDSGTLIRASL